MILAIIVLGFIAFLIYQEGVGRGENNARWKERKKSWEQEEKRARRRKAKEAEENEEP